MSDTIEQVGWFMPPSGILDGTVFDIAMCYIDRKRADEIHIMENPLYGHSENPRSSLAELEKIERHLNEQEQRLLAGDEELAFLLTSEVEQEVFELNEGLRGCVAGEAHLFFARRRAIQDLSATAIICSEI